MFPFPTSGNFLNFYERRRQSSPITLNQEIARSVEDFTTSFHKSLAGQEDGNFICSALSAHIGLGMTASGAEGSTAQELKQGLKLPYDCNDPRLHSTFQNLIDTLNSVTDVTIEAANKIFISEKLHVKDKFLEVTGTHFRSELENVNFLNSALAVAKISEWCALKTNNKIQNILQQSDVNADTRLVLLNAIYFKGSWEYKFEATKTEKKPFYLINSSVKQVPAMYIESIFYYKYFGELNAECVALPYKNSNLHMLFVIPKKASVSDDPKRIVTPLEDLEKNLEKLQLNYEEFNWVRQRVQLHLPKFKVESTMNLQGLLCELGMSEMFDQEKANFSGIFEGNESMCVDKVIQKAFIEVNEEGAEAAAVTAVTVETYSSERPPPPPPIVVKVDRPFLYRVILDKVTLFSGRVLDPSP